MLKLIKQTLSQYLSIEESKKSIVVLILISVTILGLYKAHIGNDIPPNFTLLINVICGYIFGINVGNTVTSLYSSYVSNRDNGNSNSNSNQNINDNDNNGEV